MRQVRRKLQVARAALKQSRAHASTGTLKPDDSYRATAPQHLDHSVRKAPGSRTVSNASQPLRTRQVADADAAAAVSLSAEAFPGSECESPLPMPELELRADTQREYAHHQSGLRASRSSPAASQRSQVGPASDLYAPSAGPLPNGSPSVPPKHPVARLVQNEVGAADRQTDSEQPSHDGACVVCMDAVPCVVFQPCSHTVTCRPCASKVFAHTNECPMCRCQLQGLLLLPGSK